MPSSDGRGTHDFRGAGAIPRFRPLIRGAALAFGLLATPVLAQDDPAVQRGVPAEATAANAVLAKERAIANAQRTAYQRYAAATGRDPNASQSAIESAVVSMVVEQERSTLNGYSGRYTIRFRGAGSSSTASSGGGAPPPSSSAPTPAGGLVTAPAAPAPSSVAVAAYLDAGTSFRSLDEWLALRRRLLAQPSVGSVDILGISTESARLRIGLRSAPELAAQELAGGGIVLAPLQPAAAPGTPASGWRVGLAGGA